MSHHPINALEKDFAGLHETCKPPSIVPHAHPMVYHTEDKDQLVANHLLFQSVLAKHSKHILELLKEHPEINMNMLYHNKTMLMMVIADHEFPQRTEVIKAMIQHPSTNIDTSARHCSDTALSQLLEHYREEDKEILDLLTKNVNHIPKQYE